MRRQDFVEDGDSPTTNQGNSDKQELTDTVAEVVEKDAREDSAEKWFREHQLLDEIGFISSNGVHIPRVVPTK